MSDDLRALFRLFEGMPRGGPGNEEATLEAVRRLPPLPENPRILDLGCGPGEQTLVLARELGARVEAVDLHRPFLDALESAAREQGLEDRVLTREADMGALEVEPGSVDLIWSEGAIFVLGFEAGLRRWSPWLKSPGGLLVASEASWFVDDPPAELRAFWASCYPGMATESENLEIARAAGFEPIDHFRLPGEVWWSSYYTPMEARLPRLCKEAEQDAELSAVISEMEQEMEMHRRHGDCYGYTFYLLRK